eukprot:661489-Amphidinium_carterae.1
MREADFAQSGVPPNKDLEVRTLSLAQTHCAVSSASLLENVDNLHVFMSLVRTFSRSSSPRKSSLSM